MTMLAAIAQFERKMILEQLREGIEIAKRAGKYKGRKKVSVPDIEKHYERYMRREISKPQLAKELGVCPSTGVSRNTRRRCKIYSKNRGESLYSK